jgi:tetratricopeptide (TPR) repeat protein
MDEAVPEFEAVVKASPRHPAATLLLSDCLLRMGQSQRVVLLLSPLEAELGKDRLFSYLLGTALLEQNQLERGQQLIDRLFREGDSAEARVLLGAQHLASGNHLKALPELKKAVELNPDLPSVHALYARALRADRDHDGAAREYLKELERNPNDFESNLWLGLLRREENRLEEAGDYLKRASRLRPRDPSVAYAFGRVHLAAGRLAEARKAFELLVETSPAFQQGHVLLATVYYRLDLKDLGDQQKAIVDRLRAEAKEQGKGEEGEIGPTSFAGSPTPPGR